MKNYVNLEKDVNDSDSFTKIIFDKEEATLSFVGNNKSESIKLKKTILLCRNMSNMADDDQLLYDFTVSSSELDSKFLVTIKGDLSSAIKLMNQTELTEDSKLLSDSASKSLSDLLLSDQQSLVKPVSSDSAKQLYMHGAFFKASSDSSSGSDFEKLNAKAKQAIEYISFLSEGLNEKDANFLLKIIVEQSNYQEKNNSLGGGKSDIPVNE